jgi:hypothetical protein
MLKSNSHSADVRLVGSFTVQEEDDMIEQITIAIAAHGQWRVKFQNFMDGKLDLDAAQVRKGNGCDFGQWLETDGKKAMPIEAFAKVHALHDKFHEVASEVVRKKKSGDTQGAKEALSVRGDFSKISSELIHQLTALRT